MSDGCYGLTSHALRRGFLFDMSYKLVERTKRGHWIVEYTCSSCGGVFQTNIHKFRRKKTSMCQSCARDDRLKKHGLTKHPLYIVWDGMKQRCTNPKAMSYVNYGGRGISICEEWLESFQAFYDWAIKNGYQSELSIDRINNDRGYSPENCRWATPQQQNHNRRMQYNNQSGIIGVIEYPQGWRWYLTHQGKQHSKRGYSSKQSALNARNLFIKANDLPHKIQTL